MFTAILRTQWRESRLAVVLLAGVALSVPLISLRGAWSTADPWTSWVSETGGFFGRRYRSLHRLEEPTTADEVEIALRSDLPEEVELTVFHLELRP